MGGCRGSLSQTLNLIIHLSKSRHSVACASKCRPRFHFLARASRLSLGRDIAIPPNAGESVVGYANGRLIQVRPMNHHELVIQNLFTRRRVSPATNLSGGHREEKRSELNSGVLNRAVPCLLLTCPSSRSSVSVPDCEPRSIRRCDCPSIPVGQFFQPPGKPTLNLTATTHAGSPLQARSYRIPRQNRLNHRRLWLQ